jgi:hypothetical protein
LLLVPEKPVMHRPVLALSTSSLGRFGRKFGVLMHVGQRELPEVEQEHGSSYFQQLGHHGMRGAAVGALIIPIFDNADRRAGFADGVVAIGDGHRELPLPDVEKCSHDGTAFAVITSSAARIPSAPGFTPEGEPNTRARTGLITDGSKLCVTALAALTAGVREGDGAGRGRDWTENR